MNIKVRIADPADAEAISMIGRLSFRDAFARLFQSKNELQEYLDQTYKPEKIRRSISKENNVYFIAFVENVAVGFAKVKKDSLENHIRSVSQAELQKIYVLSYYHGSGAGSALMDAVVDYVSEIGPDYLWLHVHVDNQKALRFYRKIGFNLSAKHFFTIGTQTFEFHMMCLPVAVMQPCSA